MYLRENKQVGAVVSEKLSGYPAHAQGHKNSDKNGIRSIRVTSKFPAPLCWISSKRERKSTAEQGRFDPKRLSTFATSTLGTDSSLPEPSEESSYLSGCSKPTIRDFRTGEE